MSERGIGDIIQDMLEAAQRAVDYCSGIDYRIFVSDYKTQDAVIRNIEILGEASKLLPMDFREKNAIVPWNNIAGMRDKLIHHYFGVNIDIVWDVVQSDLPTLIESLKTIYPGC